MNIDNITLLDVIDRQTLQSLQDAFANATGMAALATDSTGSVTQLSNPTEFCMNLTRKSKIGCERCNKCDLQGGSESSRTGKPSVYYCHGGLVDFAAPIIVNGRHIGSLIGGQVLPEPPNNTKFRQIASEIGVDPDRYVTAVHKVPIVPKEQIDAAANLLFQMANALSDVGYQRALAQEQSETSAAIVNEMREKFTDINAQTEQSVEAINSLTESFKSIEAAVGAAAKSVKSTDSIVKTIGSASTQLTLIGFNASIEAKRAGAAGQGFDVIAQEVRMLSDKNTRQTGEIEKTLNGIKQAMSDINAQISGVHEAIERNSDVIRQLRYMLEDANELIAKIK
ncbi:MAG: PocR ligand-binding domain-containing protein [Lachnospiraceae bacterium]|nr:PocR ligand-binding domain-containing protein [Ruminococcus sp.]MCM1273755.1 PocR ligand-binding domain-containing protein [Lachnospiraceae bacterium]